MECAGLTALWTARLDSPLRAPTSSGFTWAIMKGTVKPVPGKSGVKPPPSIVSGDSGGFCRIREISAACLGHQCLRFLLSIREPIPGNGLIPIPCPPSLHEMGSGWLCLRSAGPGNPGAQTISRSRSSWIHPLMKPMSGQILRLFESIGRAYPLELAKNHIYPPRTVTGEQARREAASRTTSAQPGLASLAAPGTIAHHP